MGESTELTAKDWHVGAFEQTGFPSTVTQRAVADLVPRGILLPLSTTSHPASSFPLGDLTAANNIPATRQLVFEKLASNHPPSFDLHDGHGTNDRPATASPLTDGAQPVGLPRRAGASPSILSIGTSPDWLDWESTQRSVCDTEGC